MIQSAILIVVVLAVYIGGDKWYYSERYVADLSKKPLEELEFRYIVEQLKEELPEDKEQLKLSDYMRLTDNYELTEEGIEQLINLLEKTEVTGIRNENSIKDLEWDYSISFSHIAYSNKNFSFYIKRNEATGEEVIYITSDHVWFTPDYYSVDNQSLVAGIEEIISEYSVQ